MKVDSVRPQQTGFVFSEYSQDLIGVAGQNSAVFSGTPAAFGISGRVADQGGNGLPNVSLSVGGSATDYVLSDADGNYIFTDLPADGIYSVSASDGTHIFSPPDRTISPLISDVGGVDFIALTPTAARVSISGQVVSPIGVGIGRAVVTLMDTHGQVHTVRTSTFGYFTFDSILSGETYLLNVSSRRYRFEPRLLSVEDSIAGLKVVAVPF